MTETVRQRKRLRHRDREKQKDQKKVSGIERKRDRKTVGKSHDDEA